LDVRRVICLLRRYTQLDRKMSAHEYSRARQLNGIWVEQEELTVFDDVDPVSAITSSERQFSARYCHIDLLDADGASSKLGDHAGVRDLAKYRFYKEMSEMICVFWVCRWLTGRRQPVFPLYSLRYRRMLMRVMAGDCWSCADGMRLTRRYTVSKLHFQSGRGTRVHAPVDHLSHSSPSPVISS
jgi:hypothetical protein